MYSFDSKGLNNIQPREDGTVYVEAGVTCAKLSKWCMRQQCEGAFFAGIPGTIGGCVVMNAGAFGGETWQYLQAIQFITTIGDLCWQPASDFVPGYRHVQGEFPGWIVGAIFKFPSVERNLKQDINALLQKRNATQPIGLPSCGSVFKNPHPNFAAQLIEQLELKGTQVGDAIISPKHANFIINQGQATSASVLNLVDKIKTTVYHKHDILLEEEFHYWPVIDR